MPKTLLQKLFFKPEYRMAVIQLPEDLKGEIKLNLPSDFSPKSSYDFILSFKVTKKDLEREIPDLRKSLNDGGILWVAYPKGKLLGTDLNRDILRELMGGQGFDGVSLVSLNGTWSCMRFRRK